MANKSNRTYEVVLSMIAGYLASLGWTVKAGLKVPHVTNPSGTIRLWFKKQSIYYSLGSEISNMGSAHSLWIPDTIRGMNDQELNAFTNRAIARVEIDCSLRA